MRQTNLYAERPNLRPHSLVKEWKPTGRAEMLTFLTMLILHGIIHKPRISIYWAKDTLVSAPIFGQLIRRDRFLLILRSLHFTDNRNFNPTDPERDRLYKIREVSEMIKKRCSEAFYPGKKLSIDESLCCSREGSALNSISSPREQDLESSFFNFVQQMGLY